MSAAALLPEEIHLKGARVQMDSPLNGKGETVFSDEAPETLKELYYNEKWGSPLQLFMPDGTVIGRVKGLEGNAALRKCFEENVLGTGEYVNYLDSETLAPYYEDGTLGPAERENYENSLYLKWLSATYGKTRMEKAGDWLMTKEGRHAALDGIGIFLDPADLVNAVLYLSEGELGDAALSGVSMIPMLGDLFGKGGKGTKYLLKAADLTKLNRNRKVVKVLENIDIFIKARKADMGELQKWIRKSLDNLAHGGDVAKTFNNGSSILSKLQGTGKVGDFSDIRGQSVEEIISRIPKEANMRVLQPVEGKVQRGVEFSWKVNGKTMRVRIHDIDLSAPSGSNAANGWIVRVQEGKKYLDPDSGIFQPPGISNPDSPFYDPQLGNSTHIPIETPREELINELIGNN